MIKLRTYTLYELRSIVVMEEKIGTNLFEPKNPLKEALEHILLVIEAYPRCHILSKLYEHKE